MRFNKQSAYELGTGIVVVAVVVVVVSIYEPYVFNYLVATSSTVCNCYNSHSSWVCGQLLTICGIFGICHKGTC